MVIPLGTTTMKQVKRVLRILIVLAALAGTIFLVITWAWSWRHMQVERYLLLAADVGGYFTEHSRLPLDVETFCEWKKDAHGKQIWDVSDTKKRLHFAPLPINDDFWNGKQHFIIIDDKRFSHIEPSVHLKLLGAMQ